MNRSYITFAFFGLFLLLCSFTIPSWEGEVLVKREKITLSGTITESQTGQPIAYASIGILNGSEGTISDEKGNFSFSVSQEKLEEMVRISAIGFAAKEVKVSNLWQARTPENKLVIALDAQPVQLAEVDVHVKKWKTKKLGGSAGPVTMVHHNFAMFQRSLHENLGHEMGILIKNGPKTAFLNKLNFCLTMNKYDLVKFRLNVYSVKDNLPYQNLAPKDIYVTVENQKRGWIAVDLEPYNLYVQDDFVVSLEWIDCLPKKDALALTIAGALPGFHTTFHKDASQAKWEKITSFGMGMNVEVQRQN
ncbi:carboxypeptidase-like regulatory domain-containing protein [Rufibacter hautae]|uniref:Carboxypeptidase-like regulatory domain-containing protein n=1 Tax=Rufibacter hautae TaxID=2595005 RepID=A0A5B6TBS1_9BACT|nr:carboxypeptidase-like regulatory domain-containing protein [Rufibacter hautae]KAA3436553.1 carboxypeptidase-like regulatory domain-containing protein [Rufibacter hautae]